MRYFIKNLNEYKTRNMTKKEWFEAITINNLELIKEYIENGFDINCSNYEVNHITDNSAIVVASFNKHLDIVKELLKCPNIDVNQQSKIHKSFTALMWACWNDDLNIVKELLKHSNIDVNILDIKKETALIIACYDQNTEIVKELLKHPNIDVNVKDHNNNTAIYYMGNPEIKDLLRKAGTKE